jgi:plasmid stabilization system protein ParE
MPQVILLPDAQRDLIRLKSFLKAKDPEAASRVSPTVKTALRRLARFPESAPLSMHPPVRLLHIPFGQAGYMAGYVYDEAADTVFAVFVKHEKEMPHQDEKHTAEHTS